MNNNHLGEGVFGPLHREALLVLQLVAAQPDRVVAGGAGPERTVPSLRAAENTIYTARRRAVIVQGTGCNA